MVALGVCLVVVAASVAGCRTKLPTSDSTPPTLTWNVFDKNANTGTDYPATANVRVVRGVPLRITLRANDPGGVQWIELRGGSTWGCTAGGVGQNMHALYKTQRQDYTADADGNVLDGAVLIMEPSTDLDCGAGYTFDAGSIQLDGRASNYYAGVASGTLTIGVTR